MVLLPLLGILLFRLNLVSYPVGIGTLLVATIPAIIGLVIGMIGSVIVFVRRVPTFLAGLASGMAICSAYLIYMMILLANVSNLPFIQDITTDVDNPPEFVAALKYRGGNSNPILNHQHTRELQTRSYPDVKTLETVLSTADSFEKAEATAQEMGWDVRATNPENGTIEAVASTFIFGFKDDIVIRITANPDTGGAFVDLRSVSRVGLADVGTNANRIRRFLEDFGRAD